MKKLLALLLLIVVTTVSAQQHLYSRTTANTWSTTNGGADCSCYPTSTDTVEISHNWANGSFYPLTHPANLAHGTYFPVSSTNNPFKVIIRSGGVGYQTGTIPTGMILQVDAGGFWGYSGSMTLHGTDPNTVALLGNEGTILANGSFTNKIALNGQGKFCRSGSFSQNNGGTLNGNADLSLDPYFVDAEYGTFCMEASTLPVELVSFECINDNILKWVTATEINNDFYEVLYCREVDEFEVVNTVLGAGNSTDIIQYIHSVSEYGYYKLRQFDFDGNSEEFTTILCGDKGLVQNKELLATYDMIGQEVQDSYIGFVVEVYSDGSTNRVYRR